jgi:tetraacyldisaccharide 4'-kinase
MSNVRLVAPVGFLQYFAYGYLKKKVYFRHMIWLRKLLFPFSIVYHAVTALRNLCYNKHWFSSYTPPVKTIVVGNLSVGGTGKTPQIEYLIRLLSSQYQLATLSRGYKRESEGFILADAQATAKSIGDEPFQFYTKFPNVQVAVDANRANGIQQLLALPNPPKVILLDDAFQHRKVNAGFYILLTAYTDLFCEDWILPAGNLRESRSGAQRAHCIIVTKCPPHITVEEQQQIVKRLHANVQQPIYFTTIAYDDKLYAQDKSIALELVQDLPKVVVAGIAKPKPFFKHLKADQNIYKQYPDHHAFTQIDIKELKNIAQGKLIITTEKDYTRLQHYFTSEQLFYLPIRTEFVTNEDVFNAQITSYLEK